MCSDMIVGLAIVAFLYLYRGKSGVCRSDSAVSQLEIQRHLLCWEKEGESECGLKSLN
jgi:hypothetical protein